MTNQTKAKKKTKKKVNKKISKREKKIRRIILGIIIVLIIIVLFILFLTSDIFNITKITVTNNSKITYEEIVQASTLQIDENIFKKSKYKITNNIKNSIPYVEDVKISKKINGEIIIDVTEREPTYMLSIEGKYAYINNQGYILEITDVPLEVPIITGYISKDITAGKRLENNDLKKLETVIQIMDTAKMQNIGNLITAIDIRDDKNYILSIPSQMKTIEFGEGNDINIKILRIIEALKSTEGQEGTIFIKNKMYFREKI